MGRILGILAIALGVWFAAQFYLGTAPSYLGTKGTDAEQGEQAVSTARRAGQKVEAAFGDAAARRDRLMPKD